MNFIEKILKPTPKADPFGIDSAVDGIRQLRTRLAEETAKLSAERDKLRDAALDDPAGDLDESAVVRQAARVEALGSAIKKATDQAAKALEARKPEIEKRVEALESKRRDLGRERDLEYLKAVREFIVTTGGGVADMPRKGHGGVIRIPATIAMELSDVESILKPLPAPGQPAATETSKKLDALAAELSKLTTLRHFGGQRGLETLAGSGV